jgi:hypothetical protein
MLKTTTSIINASQITGVLPVLNGGTGVTTNTGTGNVVLSAAPTLSGDVSLSTGNLVPGTAAKGINFTANTPAAGMTSQLLNWYEDGTFTATLTAATPPTTPPTTTAYYTRIGRTVTVQIDFSNKDTTGAAGDYSITGLPFTSSNNGTSTVGAMESFNFSIDAGCGFLSPNSTIVQLISPYAASLTTSLAGAGKYVRVSITYII